MPGVNSTENGLPRLGSLVCKLTARNKIRGVAAPDQFTKYEGTSVSRKRQLRSITYINTISKARWRTSSCQIRTSFCEGGEPLPQTDCQAHDRQILLVRMRFYK